MGSKQSKKRGLGRGLQELIGDREALSAVIGGNVATTQRQLPLQRLAPGPWQPRRQFDADAMQALVQSIEKDGVLQPVIVCPAADGNFYLVAGERRWRAAKKAGLTEIPVVEMAVDEKSAATLALVENLLREDLNAIEQARGLQRLASDYSLNHEQIGQRVGMTRSAVSNLIRLLSLPGTIQQQVENGELAMGNARTLLALPTTALQLSAAAKACEQTVRQTEAMVSGILRQQQRQPNRRPVHSKDTDADVFRLEKDLSDHLGTEVRIQHRSRQGHGKLIINYSSPDVLQGILQRLGLDSSDN